MKKENWIWMPHVAHFCCGDRCQFRLATYVGKYIVSTVGDWWPSRSSREIHAKVYDKEWLYINEHLKGDDFDYAYLKEFGYTDVGCDRKYETMVFKAKKSKQNCCPWEMKSCENLDMDGYNLPTDARKGHMRLCDKWSKK